MRVIAGKARRLALVAPKGDKVRPTTDRTKETLFNILAPLLRDSIVLDVFSGSGAIGIEALSRGAKKAYFIENDPEAQACIRENLSRTGLEAQGEILPYDFARALDILKGRQVQADLVFLDPPYGKGLEEQAIGRILGNGLLAPEGTLVCESAEDTGFSFLEAFPPWEVEREKRFKTNKFTWVKGKRDKG
ncbi:16S rRNA (guanine(966)-N(2))-methyltransferase RsmD [Anaerotalea alkaliphila]|uniref:16S rRNA (Guanine(966)-N(2))-methyltransferase RsmD n=1 Tax=Anaerotalea alkaliphila TaxID=2662126 RepID=A0A7X5HUG4_9FIRM|nr:16S rRNA (guanine(966)-N(2))-methyltransferase RsmD [Anaerotalea alkaliphila]NDL66878.1 16S rRNA (guanine(966)-N(2))-methyltransferase RsmD [Anaerotalea alkaliphila]